MHLEKLPRMKHKRSIRADYRDLLKTMEWRQCAFRKIEEAGHKCWNCGSGKHLDVHHLTYRDILPWDYVSEELRVLCRDCHEAVHHVADLVWVECLRFEPHVLEVLLKRLQGVQDSGEPRVNAIEVFRSVIKGDL
jgi:hypothetical protein